MYFIFFLSVLYLVHKFITKITALLYVNSTFFYLCYLCRYLGHRPACRHPEGPLHPHSPRSSPEPPLHHHRLHPPVTTSYWPGRCWSGSTPVSSSAPLASARFALASSASPSPIFSVLPPTKAFHQLFYLFYLNILKVI